jgi:cell division protein ZapE
VVIVCTSNLPPDDLYADGFNRDRFVPAIAAIKAHMQVVAVNGAEDHRLHPGAGQQRYFVASPEQESALCEVFQSLATGQQTSAEPIPVGHRTLNVVQACETVLWCRYADLCEQPFAAMDFIALCDTYRTILLSDVPNLSAQKRESRIARGTEDGAARVEAGTASCRNCQSTTTACGGSSRWSTSVTTARCRCTSRRKCR